MQITDDERNYLFNFISTICDKFGPRYSCSKAEKDAANWMQGELAKFCDETENKPFQTWPSVYPQGLFLIMGIFCLAGMFWMLLPSPWPIFSIIFIIIGFAILYLELYKIKRWIAFLFPKGESRNVFGVVKPTGAIKYRVIMEGHTDSARMMPNFNFPKGKPPFLKFGGAILYVFVTIIFSIVKVIIGLNGPTLVLDIIYWIFMIILVPIFIVFIKGFISKEVVMGANDNLSGGAVSVAVAKYFADPKHRLKHIELWCGSNGSEENGDSGAQAFVATHEAILSKSYNVAIDTIGGGNTVMVLIKDTMHGVGECPAVTSRLEKAWNDCHQEDPKIINFSRGKLTFSSSDSCRFQHKGYDSAAIICLNQGAGLNKPPNVHMLSDIPKNIEIKTVADVYHMMLHFCQNVDNEYKD